MGRLCREFGRRVMLMRRLGGNRLISCALCVCSREEEVYPKEEATAQPTQSQHSSMHPADNTTTYKI